VLEETVFPAIGKAPQLSGIAAVIHGLYFSASTIAEEEIFNASKLAVLTALLILGFAIPVASAKDASGTQGYVMAAGDEPSATPVLRTLAQMIKVQPVPMDRAAVRIRVARSNNAPAVLEAQRPQGAFPRGLFLMGRPARKT
jgi:hypothetical protein